MNQSPPSQSTHPDDMPEPDAPNTPQPAPFDHAPAGAERKAADGMLPPAPRAPVIPPPLPTFGAPQPPPRFATPPQRPPGSSARPPAEQPPYPPRVPAPHPAPPGGMTEPPRPYEGGRYIPPPPLPPTGPSVPGRDWSAANTTITPPAPPPTARHGNPMTTALLGVIVALLLALTVFQGINTFHPKAASGVQQVQVQKLALKPTTAAEVKDTVTNAQTSLNQFNQKVQDAYSGATTDAQRQAVLLQSLILLQQIIAQQNNDLLLIYQDLNP